jgi:radical SAM superfamily enzyme YgiQ (UPF0313 family)
MNEQAPDRSLFDEFRGLAPGFLVCFARRANLKSSGHSVANRARFPHVRGLGLGNASPEFLATVAAFGRDSHTTVRAVIDSISNATGTERKRLEAFATALANAGYLISDPPPKRWGADALFEQGEPSPVANDELLEVPEGSTLLVDGDRFVWFDHDGRCCLSLDVEEMIAIQQFGEAVTIGEAWTRLGELDAKTTISRATVESLAARARQAGLLRAVDRVDESRTPFDPTERNARQIVLDGVLEAVGDYEALEMSRPGARAAVVPVNDDHNMAPLALGLLSAYAREFDGGRLRERFDFVPLFLAEEHTLLEWAKRPAIFLFSNYIWNIDRNLQLSSMLKAANPLNITIHGGPSTPKYTQDCELFFREHLDVDITVRGEGEATFAAILDALDPERITDLSPLRDVAGLSFRGADGIVHTGDRDRIEDLDTIPSPYLMGLFEPFGRAHVAAVVESNRGCPYGCTFCDWGSATLSRIRKFDLERVKAELEWFSKNELLFVSLCDANFGILERDVEIAEHIAAMKTKYGYPRTAALNYAKNTMKHLRRIIDVFSQAGLTIEPTVALQSMDEQTLKVIKRSNIKLSKYDELADEFRRLQLPLATDIMMGLPGSTYPSFKDDLQKCTDRDIRARCNPTVLLPNSPMNDPAYRLEHGIVARPHEIVKQSKTFSRDDFDKMDQLRVAFYVFDNFGVLRHFARFVRSETGVKEVDFFERITQAALAEPLRWPALSSFVRMMNDNLAPPSSWSLFMGEVAEFAIVELGVDSGDALDTAVRVQLAHLPAPDRELPQTLRLAHDYVAWHESMLEARRSFRDDWERYVPRLREFPPGELEVDDPHDICGTMVGKPLMVMAWNVLGWDMMSPVARGQVVAPAG